MSDKSDTEEGVLAAPSRKPAVWKKRLAAFLLVLAGLVLLLFVLNGTSEYWRTPRTGVLPSAPDAGHQKTVTILAYNIAKCFAYSGVTRFACREEVTERLDAIAAIIKAEKPDLVFLSEVVNECGPVPVDQVAYLAEECGFPFWASSDNYSWGLPFFRIRSGNAVLSRFPLSSFETTELVGDSTIWNPTNNRRVLWFDVEINGRSYLAASLRNDSFDLENNSRQVDQILAHVADRPAILAGDFNAEPSDESMVKFKESERFSGAFAGAPTYSTLNPWQRIDFVLAPRSWTLVRDRVLDNDTSDHLPVLAVFSLPH